MVFRGLFQLTETKCNDIDGSLTKKSAYCRQGWRGVAGLLARMPTELSPRDGAGGLSKMSKICVSLQVDNP